MMICDRRLRGEEGEEGFLFTIMRSWHSALCPAVYYLLMPIHDVHCPVGTAWKHTLSSEKVTLQSSSGAARLRDRETVSVCRSTRRLTTKEKCQPGFKERS